MSLRPSRRQVIGTMGTAATLGVAGCLASLSGGSALERQLDTAREATAKYADPRRALEDGFQVFGPYVPGMGWHFIHPGRGQRIAEEGFDLESPNLLTYDETDDGLVLGAVEWGAPVEAVPDAPDLFDDNGAESWHVHAAATHVFALPDGQQTAPPSIGIEDWLTNAHWSEFRPPDPAVAAGDAIALHWGSLKGKSGERTERVVDVAVSHPDLNTLHAWVHTENPEGTFNPVNPEVGGGSHGH